MGRLRKSKGFVQKSVVSIKADCPYCHDGKTIYMSMKQQENNRVKCRRCYSTFVLGKEIIKG